MAKLIFTVITKDVFSEGGQVKEVVDINAVMEDINHECPSAADHLVNIINKMAPQIIKAANFHYVNEWKARTGNTESNTTH
ncbi:hypothetical protein G5642_03520 [Citrobacter freundii]|nr:hypothetical protein [Citrobacter freundii]